MAAIYNRNKTNHYPQMIRQKSLIEKDFDCFKCSIQGRGVNARLICKGEIKPTEFSINYKIQLFYSGIGAPKVFVVEPDLPLDLDAHMYKDKSLCLYYPKEDPWNHSKSISDTIIPWVSEWLVYYELYQIDGMWHGPYVPHGEDEKDYLKDK